MARQEAVVIACVAVLVAWAVTAGASKADDACGLPCDECSNWCSSPYLGYIVDCDGDGKKEYACLDGSGMIAAQSSRNECRTLSDNDQSVCPPIFQVSSCPPVTGYTATVGMDIDGGDLSFFGASPDNNAYYTSLLTLVTQLAKSCSNDDSCIGFNSLGALKSEGGTLFGRQGVCLYKKAGNDAPVKDCDQPPEDAWCSWPAVVFNLDCDGDGRKDWACTSYDGYYTTALSSNGCQVSSSELGDTGVCKPAFQAPPTGDCPVVEGYIGQRGDAPGNDIDTVLISDSLPEAFKSQGQLLALAAATCDTIIDDDVTCVGFNSLGYLKTDVSGFKADKTSSFCLYKRRMDDGADAPAPAGGVADCGRPSNDWCNGMALQFNVDCDGDGAKDWACTSLDGYYLTALSSSQCEVARSELGDINVCAAAFVAPSVCPSIWGFDVFRGDAPGNDIGTVLDYPEGADVSTTQRDLYMMAARACMTKGPSCVGFNTLGYLKSDVSNAAQDDNSPFCLYTKQKPPACERPSGSAFCSPPANFFNLDCDDDGVPDWTCTDGTRVFTVLSSRGCAVTQYSSNGWHSCPAAYYGVGYKSSKAPGGMVTDCPDFRGLGFVAYAKMDIPSSISGVPLSFLPQDKNAQQPNTVYTSLERMLGAAITACALQDSQPWCGGVTSSGMLLKAPFPNTVLKTSEYGCVYQLLFLDETVFNPYESSFGRGTIVLGKIATAAGPSQSQQVTCLGTAKVRGAAPGGMCSGTKLAGYKEVDLICPSGQFIKTVKQLVQINEGSVFFEETLVKMTEVTCSGGQKVLADWLPPSNIPLGITTDGADRFAFGGMTAIAGQNAGTATNPKQCAIGWLKWYEQVPPRVGSSLAWTDACADPKTQRITSMRIGYTDTFINNIRVCCSTVAL